MTSEYQRKTQTEWISRIGAVAGVLLAFGIPISTTTHGPLLGIVLVGLIGGLLVSLLAFAVDEPHIGALIPFVYGVGIAALGLPSYGHDGILLRNTLFAVGGGILVTLSAMHRWKSWVSAPTGAVLGATGASLVLYVL
jgi:hypothetical protein